MANAETIAQNKAKALELLKTGLSVRAVAREMGITPAAICLWTIKDPDFNEVWEASVVANHLAVIAVNNEDIEDFREEVRIARKIGKTEDAPLLAIEAKLLDRKQCSSIAVLTRLAKSFAEKLETKNQTQITGDLNLSDVATMGDCELHDVIRNTTQQG